VGTSEYNAAVLRARDREGGREGGRYSCNEHEVYDL